MLLTYIVLILILFFLLTTLIPKNVLDWQLEFRKNNLEVACDDISQQVEFYLRFYDSSIYGTYLDNLTRQYATSMSSRVMIYDSYGRILSDSFRQFGFQNLYLKEIDESLSGKTAWNSYYFRDIGNVLYLSVPVTYEDQIIGGIFVSNSINDLFDNVNEMNHDIRQIIFFAGILITIGIAIISNHFLKPINKFYPVIARLSAGDFTERVDVKTNDEFKMLANSFNTMSVKLDEVDRQRRDFVGNVSHELKTPLASIKLLSESLLLQDNVEAKVYREFLIDINNEIDRLNNIVSDLLVLVNMDKKQLVLDYQPAYLNYLIEKVIEQLKPLADQKKIKIVFKEKNSIQTKIDKGKIKQAIINIVHNGINYTQVGGQVTISLYREKEFAVIKVQDNGYGIAEENIPYVFDRFYRTDKARSRITGGTGLGLSIAKQIINLHHGFISLSSEVGKGSTFYVRLPLS
jgi:signal transduction histidine kinase